MIETKGKSLDEIERAFNQKGAIAIEDTGVGRGTTLNQMPKRLRAPEEREQRA